MRFDRVGREEEALGDLAGRQVAGEESLHRELGLARRFQHLPAACTGPHRLELSLHLVGERGNEPAARELGEGLAGGVQCRLRLVETATVRHRAVVVSEPILNSSLDEELGGRSSHDEGEKPIFPAGE